MADAEPVVEPLAPLVVTYDKITGIPTEFNDFLPKDSDEYKRLQSHKEASTAAAAVEALSVSDAKDPKPAAEGDAAPGESKPPGEAAAPPPPADKPAKKKKEKKNEILIEVSMRNKRKMTTTISGLDTFGIKLADAAKIMGKKFACGASVTKTADQKEHIEVQGDFLFQSMELILKTYGDKGITQDHLVSVDGGKKKKDKGGGEAAEEEA